MNSEQALRNAMRLLERAELELTNLPLMATLDSLAMSWIKVSELLAERERV
ncbi:hypothetical protein ACU686_40435 [Yinghuangia aomiensis]